MKKVLIVAVPAIALVAAGIFLGVTLLGSGGSERVATDGEVQFPDFVYSSASVEYGYRLAVDNQDLMAHLPCYCGCGKLPDDAHRNLLDCFINDDGTFDAHASGCTVCIDIANDGVSWRANGSSIDEVRSLVDEKYQSYGPPTVS